MHLCVGNVNLLRKWLEKNSGNRNTFYSSSGYIFVFYSYLYETG